MGAILRSAYFLGVDAITLSSRNWHAYPVHPCFFLSITELYSAPLSPVCLKASAGAAELLPIFEQSRSDRLIVQSAEAGWTFYAAVPPPTKNQARRDRYVLASEVGDEVKKGPTVLVLGSEGITIFILSISVSSYADLAKARAYVHF
jgi:tRNA G18 (ribose-2'-O)-methylase SpoU